MHVQSAEIFKHFKSCRTYETAFALKEERKVRHVAFPSTTERRCWSRS